MPDDTPSVPTKTPAARRRFRLTRDGVLFVVGLAGIIWEAVVNHGENTTLIILFGAMVGLPAFLHGDEALAKRAAPPAPKPNGESS